MLRFGQLYGLDRAGREILHRARERKPVVLARPDGWLTPLHPEDAARRRGGARVRLGRLQRGGVAGAAQPMGLRDPARLGRSHRPVGKLLPRVQRLAARTEPLTRSLRVSSALFRDATGWRPRYDALGGGWSDVPAADLTGVQAFTAFAVESQSLSALSYTRTGAGEPLVLLHGIGMSRQVWEPVIPALAQHLRRHRGRPAGLR